MYQKKYMLLKHILLSYIFSFSTSKRADW